MKVKILFGLALLMMVGCAPKPGAPSPTPQDDLDFSYEERVACEELGRKEGRSTGYCWSNKKPEGGTR